MCFQVKGQLFQQLVIFFFAKPYLKLTFINNF